MAGVQQGIKSVEQGALLVEALVSSARAMPLKQLAHAVGMTPSGAHRYLVSLMRAGLVQQDADTGYYDIGPFAIRIGLAALGRLDFMQATNRELRQLVLAQDIDGHVSVWGDFGPTIVSVHGAINPILTNLRLGAVLPLLTSATGRVFLTYLPRSRTKEMVAHELLRAGSTEDAETVIDKISEETRRDRIGVASNHLLIGMSSFASPIFDFQGSLRAVIGLVGPDASLKSTPSKVSAGLQLAAMRASVALGWREADDQTGISAMASSERAGEVS